MDFPGGCCSPECKSPVETCGQAACWVGWVLTGDLSGTKAGAVGLTGHSERDHNTKMLRDKRNHKTCAPEVIPSYKKGVLQRT